MAFYIISKCCVAELEEVPLLFPFHCLSLAQRSCNLFELSHHYDMQCSSVKLLFLVYNIMHLVYEDEWLRVQQVLGLFTVDTARSGQHHSVHNDWNTSNTLC